MDTTLHEPTWSAPTHFASAFTGQGAYEALASRFLAKGIPRGERLIYVAHEPRPEHWPSSLLTSRRLVIASVTETYGMTGLVDATRQHETFRDVLAEALAAGYLGIRVAADNTHLVRDQEGVESWMRWEALADAFMTANPVVGLCAFDRDVLGSDVAAALAVRHRSAISLNR